MILVLGPSVAAVILFEIILNASALFNHADEKSPLWAGKLIRTVVVTPDMHRIHQSMIPTEYKQ